MKVKAKVRGKYEGKIRALNEVFDVSEKTFNAPANKGRLEEVKATEGGK